MRRKDAVNRDGVQIKLEKGGKKKRGKGRGLLTAQHNEIFKRRISASIQVEELCKQMECD